MPRPTASSPRTAPPSREGKPPRAVVAHPERAANDLRRLQTRARETFALSRRVDGLAAAVVTKRAVADLVAFEVPAFRAETEMGTLTWMPAPEPFDLDASRARRARRAR